MPKFRREVLGKLRFASKLKIDQEWAYETALLSEQEEKCASFTGHLGGEKVP